MKGALMKKLMGVLALLLLFSTPVMAAETCQCNDSCRKSCAEGKADSCGCKHCDCKDCQCDGKAAPTK